MLLARTDVCNSQTPVPMICAQADYLHAAVVTTLQIHVSQVSTFVEWLSNWQAGLRFVLYLFSASDLALVDGMLVLPALVLLQPAGDVLIFLTGQEEIEACEELLKQV